MDFDESRLYYSHQQLQISTQQQRQDDNDNTASNHLNNTVEQLQQQLHDDDQVDWTVVRRHFRESLRESVSSLRLVLMDPNTAITNEGGFLVSFMDC